MDRLYTSFEVADWLLDQDITMVGTIMSNRVGIPPAIKPVENREVNSYLLFWRSDGLCNISSYVPSTSKGKKNVMVVSTLQPLLGVTKDDKTKPAIIKLYDFTKGGTDIVDQKMGAYTTKSKSRKWTKVVFFYLLDTICVNASTIYALANNISPTKVNSFEFGVELADALIMPFISTRSTNGLASTIRSKMVLYLGRTSEEENEANKDGPYERVSKERGRCRVCLDGIQGPGYKQQKKRNPTDKNDLREVWKYNMHRPFDVAM